MDHYHAKFSHDEQACVREKAFSARTLTGLFIEFTEVDLAEVVGDAALACMCVLPGCM